MNSRLDKYKNIFNPTGCISEEQILKYHKKSLPHEEMHKIERHLLDCQLCSDALEGLESQGNQETIMGEIKNEIHSRANPSKANLNFKTIAIAAFLVMSFGISFLIYKKIIDSEKPETLVTEAESNRTEENEFPAIKQDSSLTYKEESKEADEVVPKYPETPQNNLIATLPEKKKELQSKTEEKILDIPAQPTLSEVINFDQRDQTISDSVEESSNIKDENNDIKTIAESVYTATDESENLPETLEESEVQSNEKLELGKTYYSAPSMEKNKSMESKAAQQVDNRNYKENADNMAATSALSSDKIFSNAMEKYNSKEYKEAVVMFQSMLQNNPKNDEVIYYAALSYYNIQEFKMSVKYFEIITKNKKSSFFEGSQWHLALSYIANNEINKAKKLLKLIIDEQGKYELEAQQQLEKMK